MPTNSVDNALCRCKESAACTSCGFCARHKTTEDRKALCEKIPAFYRFAVGQIPKLALNRVFYDEQNILQRILSGVLLILIAPAISLAGLPSSYDYYPGSPLILGANFDPNHITEAKTPLVDFSAVLGIPVRF